MNSDDMSNGAAVRPGPKDVLVVGLTARRDANKAQQSLETLARDGTVQHSRPNGCLTVFGISARNHVVCLFGVQCLADATFQLFQDGMGTDRELFAKFCAC